jgi:anti-anti-sigma factor
MNVRSTTVDGVQQVRFYGGDALDFACAPAVRRQLDALVRDERDVVLDLGGVAFVDSAGLSVLVGLFKSTHARGRTLMLVGVRPAVLEVMRVIRLDEIFRFAGSLDEALDRLRRAG